ncbi:hypothetical protein LTR62_001223 [Meristemomyces frigidus]|uniref:Isochorismatase-like domain-containing protein n=1 Tax=Meristemomyces frigidus TaxID=1508187 RepID=A0AAN7TKM9_9PEZI|nr:hypothetical protein LTR62_001223 [Meristemomyces frigidus]
MPHHEGHSRRKYSPAETALLLIDVQQGFKHPSYWGTEWSTPSFQTNITQLIASFRQAGAPILHVCNHSISETSPLHPSKEGSKLMPYAESVDSEPVLSKTTNSAFVGTKLEAEIRARGIKRLVVAGLTTAHCVATTVRFASNLGVVAHRFGTPDVDDTCNGALVLVSDATATTDLVFEGRRFDAETIHAVHLASMKDEFCDVERTEEVLATLSAGAKHRPAA